MGAHALFRTKVRYQRIVTQYECQSPPHLCHLSAVSDTLPPHAHFSVSPNRRQWTHSIFQPTTRQQMITDWILVANYHDKPCSYLSRRLSFVAHDDTASLRLDLAPHWEPLRCHDAGYGTRQAPSFDILSAPSNKLSLHHSVQSCLRCTSSKQPVLKGMAYMTCVSDCR